jgi:hypothetical protein
MEPRRSIEMDFQIPISISPFLKFCSCKFLLITLIKSICLRSKFSLVRLGDASNSLSF